MKFTLAALTSAMTLIGFNMLRDYSFKAGNMFRNSKGSYKIRWVLKYYGMLGLLLKTTNEMV